jgi:hypothetical protein
VKDLVEIVNIPSSPKAFNTYQNVDFATIKGVDVGLAMRPIHHISGSVNYSLSFAKGTGSVSNSHSNIAWTASPSNQPPKQTAPLDFDQRHKLSMNMDWRLGKGEGPLVGHWRVFENFGINALLNVASGTPFTPTFIYDEVTLANVSAVPSGPLNSRYGPWTSNLDLKLDKGFNVGSFQLNAFMWVLNVFDSRNAITVFTSTGAATSTGYLDTPAGQAAEQSAHDKGKDFAGGLRGGSERSDLLHQPAAGSLRPAHELLAMTMNPKESDLRFRILARRWWASSRRRCSAAPTPGRRPAPTPSRRPAGPIITRRGCWAASTSRTSTSIAASTSTRSTCGYGTSAPPDSRIPILD